MIFVTLNSKIASGELFLTHTLEMINFDIKTL